MSHRSPETPLILTLDIGTSSTRAMLFDARAQPIDGCVAQLPYRVRITPEGGAEFDVNELFDAIIGSIDRLLATAGPLANQIGGVAVDTMVTNIVGVNAVGEAITPVLTYADTRSAPQAERLRAELGPDETARIHDRTGALIHASYLPPRFRWMAEHRPDWLRQVVRWVSVGEVLFWRLFRRWQVSYSVASWTGLFNRHTLAWDEGWLKHLPIEAGQLSPPGDINTPLYGLEPEWGSRWPALKTVPWFLAIGDGAAANIGSGCSDPSRLALTIGTSGAMRIVMPAASLERVPPGLWFYRVDAERGLLGGATTEGGNLYAWFSETLRLPPADKLEQALAEMPPAAHGLSMLPFVAGERAPGWHDYARASIMGLSLNTAPVDIVRAGLEAIAYRFGQIYRHIVANLADSPAIVAGGGVLNSPAWLQIFADVLGQPVITLTEKETTSRGVALLALESLALIDSVSDLPPATGQIFKPNPDHTEQYRLAFEKHKIYYDLLIDQADSLLNG